MSEDNRKFFNDGYRVESGKIQFDDDWPGIFLRGKDAYYLATQIESMVNEIELKSDPTDIFSFVRAKTLKGYSEMLKDAEIKNEKE